MSRISTVRQTSSESKVSLRLGAAALGLLAGLVIGLLLAVAAIALAVLQAVPFATWVFGTALLLAFACFAWPSVAFAVVPGLAHFLVGAAQGAAADTSFEITATDPAIPGWLKVVFYAGVAVGVAMLVVSHS